MSKYMKLEDIEEAFAEVVIASNREVAEEVVRIIRAIKQRIALLPTIEVSEDCISRKAIISRIESERSEWGEDYDVEQILGDIEDAPSVVPKAKEEETPFCSECEHYEDHHTSLACATCPVITKVWGGAEE